MNNKTHVVIFDFDGVIADSMTHLHRGMKVVLQDLHETYYIALNSQATHESCEAFLKHHKIDKHFDTLMLAEDGHSKVDKSEEIMSEFNVSPFECLFITDTQSDVLAAEEAGVPSIGVTWGVSTREDFEEGEVGDGVVAVVDSAEELYDAILHHFG